MRCVHLQAQLFAALDSELQPGHLSAAAYEGRVATDADHQQIADEMDSAFKKNVAKAEAERKLRQRPATT